MGLIISGAGDKAFVAGADVEALLKRGREDALKGINSKLFLLDAPGERAS